MVVLPRRILRSASDKETPSERACRMTQRKTVWTGSEVCAALRWLLLASRRLPQLELVPFRVDHPAELPVFGLVDLFVDLHALSPKSRQQPTQVFYSVVDHERRRTRSEVLR